MVRSIWSGIGVKNNSSFIYSIVMLRPPILKPALYQNFGHEMSFGHRKHDHGFKYCHWNLPCGPQSLNRHWKFSMPPSKTGIETWFKFSMCHLKPASRSLAAGAELPERSCRRSWNRSKNIWLTDMVGCGSSGLSVNLCLTKYGLPFLQNRRFWQGDTPHTPCNGCHAMPGRCT